MGDARLLLARARATKQPVIMGVLNVTPDSFSDGGRYVAENDWRARIDAMLDEGADIVDVGGESTRPGAIGIDEDEQKRRVLGPIEYAAKRRGAVVSIDTTLPAVASAALAAGASIVNDVSCLADPALAEVARRNDALLVVMHSRGSMARMPGFSTYPDAEYGDVVADVARELGAAKERAIQANMAAEDVLVDPGLGFHKNASQSFALLRRLRELAPLGDLVVGASRKSFLARDVKLPPDRRVGGSIAAAIHAAEHGALVLRVHDVCETRHALAVARALRGDA